MHSNCLIWAACRWWRRGGYVVVRRSRLGPFPHFLWSRDLRRFWAFQPFNPRPCILPPLLFRGRPKLGN
jgi:hypothetical protein